MIAAAAGICGAAELSGPGGGPGDPVFFPDLVPGPHSITQSVDPATITPNNSISCNNGFGHTENSYLRRFFLDTGHGIVNQFDIVSIDIGVDRSSSASGIQQVNVRGYSIPKGAPLTFANMSSFVATAIALADGGPRIVNVGSAGFIADPTTHDLVIEVHTPDGQVDGNLFWIGSNANGETHPSYFAAADCGIPEPTPFADLGFPNVHVVMTVHGTELPVELMSFTVE
jgi:hypothetical protein